MAIEPTVTIPFVMLKDYPQEGFDEHGRFTATAAIRCKWEDRLALALKLKGTYIDAESDMVMLPAPYTFAQLNDPQNPANVARVRSVSIRPWFGEQVDKDWALSVGVASFARYQYAELTVTYGIDWECFLQADQSRIIRHETDTQGEVLSCETTTGSPLYYASDGSAVAAVNRPSTMIASVLWKMTIENVSGPTALSNALEYAVGSCNSTALVLPFKPYSGFQAGIEQVLLQGYRMIPFWSPDGKMAWSVELSLAVKMLPYLTGSQSGGWNCFFKPGAFKSERIITDPSDPTSLWLPFPPIDLNTVFANLCVGD